MTQWITSSLKHFLLLVLVTLHTSNVLSSTTCSFLVYLATSFSFPESLKVIILWALSLYIFCSLSTFPSWATLSSPMALNLMDGYITSEGISITYNFPNYICNLDFHLNSKLIYPICAYISNR